MLYYLITLVHGVIIKARTKTRNNHKGISHEDCPLSLSIDIFNILDCIPGFNNNLNQFTHYKTCHVNK